MSAALVRKLAFGAAAAGVCVGVVAAGAPMLGFRWDPFDRAARRIAHLEARLEQADSASIAYAAVAEAEARQSARLEAHQRRAIQATEVVSDLSRQAQEAPDAEHPLSPDRVDRLRDADRRLCGLVPELCVADAAAQPPGVGDHAMPPAGAA